jgi:hypothetical protein
MLNIEQDLRDKGYVKIVSMGVSQDDQLQEYTEALRMSPRYVDHVTVFDNSGAAVLYAKKLDVRVGESKYRSAIVERLDKQTHVGLGKYATLLQDNNLNTMARLEYLAEELTDGLQYIEHTKESVSEVFDDIAGIASRIMVVSGSCDPQVRNMLIEIARDANNLLGKVMGYAPNEQGRKEDSGQSE